MSLSGPVVALVLLVFCPAPDETKVLLTWGQKGDKPGEFHSPIAIAVSRKDEIYVTDNNNARLQKFSADGKVLGGFDLPLDTSKRKSSQSGGLAIDDQGQIYISLMSQHRIGIFAEDGRLVREWGKPGKGDGEFDQPGGIVLAADGTVLVADQGNHRIQRFTREGKFLQKWGEHGKEAGQFDGTEPAGSRFGGPHLLAIDGKGRIYSTEGVLGRVQQFSPEGKPLLAWGDKGAQPGGFGATKFSYSKNTFGPIGVFVDRHDRVWVSSLNDRVQAFTPEGRFLLGIGGTGNEPGRFARPHGMAVDSKGCLYVADAGNQRIQKFEIPVPNPIEKYRSLEFPPKAENFDKGWKDRVALEHEIINAADLPSLRAALKDPDLYARSMAARALGILSDRESAEALADLALKDAEHLVRTRAVEALGHLKMKGEVVEQAKKDRHGGVRWVAELAAGQVRSETDYASLVREAYAAGISRDAMDRAKVGQPAPDFTARMTDGRVFKLSDLLGKKPVVFYFAAFDG